MLHCVAKSWNLVLALCVCQTGSSSTTRETWKDTLTCDPLGPLSLILGSLPWLLQFLYVSFVILNILPTPVYFLVAVPAFYIDLIHRQLNARARLNLAWHTVDLQVSTAFSFFTAFLCNLVITIDMAFVFSKSVVTVCKFWHGFYAQWNRKK